jgi:hypothetical protein
MFVVHSLLLDQPRCRGCKVLRGSVGMLNSIPAVSKSPSDRALLVCRACAIDICYIVGSLVGLADKYLEAIENEKSDV